MAGLRGVGRPGRRHRHHQRPTLDHLDVVGHRHDRRHRRVALSAQAPPKPTLRLPRATPSTTRDNLQKQYNDILSQIDTLAADASYNGINLLNGDDLKVVFNEDGSSSQTITGVDFTSTGLVAGEPDRRRFPDNGDIDAVIADLDAALDSLRSQAAKFGSNLTTVQIRQDFTKNMVNTLQTGADSLVLADTNEEGANLLALQTRQQLSTTALSLSAQADQAVLRLF